MSYFLALLLVAAAQADPIVCEQYLAQKAPGISLGLQRLARAPRLHFESAAKLAEDIRGVKAGVRLAALRKMESFPH